MRLVHAELLKIRTAPWTAVTLTLALIAIVTLGAAGTSNDAAAGFTITEESDIVDIGGTATIFALILGILVVTWDYRHGTVTQMFLVSPRRERVLAAKLVTAVCLGAVLAAIALALSIAIAEIWLGDQFQLEREHWEQAGRILVAALLWSVLGLGLGATVQTQVGALMSAIIWFLVVELVLAGFGSRIGELHRYLPGQVLQSFAGSGEPEGISRSTAGLVAAAYAVGLAAIGTFSVLRRDVH